MNKKTMKVLRTRGIAFVIALLFIGTGQLFAQSWNVENVKMELQNGPLADIESCIMWIDKAADHKKTMNSPKMYLYRGITYLKVATEYPELAAKNPTALDIAYESFNKCIEMDSKKAKYSSQAKEHMLNVAIAYYNEGYSQYEAQTFDGAITAFNRTKELLAYDVNGDLKRANLTEEAVIQMLGYCGLGQDNNELAISSFSDLVNRGSAESNIYIALAQLHLKQQDTTTALEVIEEGKELYEFESDLINMELDI
jgi:tetratricopeptide (TPR) repeat protein